jgi:hypothetical protein
MRTPSIALLAAAMAAAAVTAGCGGSVFSAGSSGGDGGATDGAAHDASPGPFDGGILDGFAPGDSAAPWSPVCPATLPAAGTPCSKDDLQCEYGDAWWSVGCDTVMQCQSGVWSTFMPSFEPCQAQPGPNSAACPPDYAAVPQGSACSTDGLSCIYDQGECACQVPLEGPVEIDGGTGYWGCVPEQGCPFPRARLGTACTSSQADCTYEECSYAQSCQDGVWQAQPEACAGAAGGGPGQP